MGSGDSFAPRRIGKGGEFPELAAAPLAHRIGERIAMVAEEQERRHACALLTHEHERDLRSEHLQRNAASSAQACSAVKALAEGAVSDLIVILQKEHEGGRRRSALGAPRLAVAMP